MTGYRNDREALRDRADQLERELVDARRELQVRDVVLSHAEAEVDRLRRKAGERAVAQVDEGWTGRGAAVAVVSAIVLMVGGGVAVAAMMRAAPAPAPPAVARQVEPAPVPLAPEVPPAIEVPGVAVAPTHLGFGATVTTVSGRSDLKPGQRCELLVDATHADGRLRFDEILVRCGAVEVYRFSDGGSMIMSSTSWAAGPAPDDGENRWHARFEDLGTRSSDARPQIAFDSERGAGRIFSEGVAPMEVRLAMERLGRHRAEAIPPRP